MRRPFTKRRVGASEPRLSDLLLGLSGILLLGALALLLASWLTRRCHGHRGRLSAHA